jgi:hypothetical protein
MRWLIILVLVPLSVGCSGMKDDDLDDDDDDVADDDDNMCGYDGTMNLGAAELVVDCIVDQPYTDPEQEAPVSGTRTFALELFGWWAEECTVRVQPAETVTAEYWMDQGPFGYNEEGYWDSWLLELLYQFEMPPDPDVPFEPCVYEPAKDYFQVCCADYGDPESWDCIPAVF